MKNYWLDKFVSNRIVKYNELLDASCDNINKIVGEAADKILGILVSKYAIPASKCDSSIPCIREWLVSLAVLGDLFVERIIVNEKLVELRPIPATTMFRIQTVKGELVEFQQSKRGPDYSVVGKSFSVQSAKVIRFSPQEIIHLRICPGFCYGKSMLEVETIAVNDLVDAFCEALPDMVAI